MIVPTLARMIVREHIYKPIQGKMLTLGRQTIAMTYEQYCLLLHQEGYVVPQQIIEETQIILDQVTRVGKGGGGGLITLPIRYFSGYSESKRYLLWMLVPMNNLIFCTISTIRFHNRCTSSLISSSTEAHLITCLMSKRRLSMS